MADPTNPDPLAWHRTLEQAIVAWEPATIAADLAAAEQERAQILAEFPLASWGSLAVERFAQGASPDGGSFCSWLEHRSPWGCSRRTTPRST